MKFSHYNDRPVQVAVDLINTLDVMSGVDKLASPDDVTDFVAGHEGGGYERGWTASERDLREIKTLRSSLRAVFDTPDEKEAAARINAVLSDARAMPRLSLHGEGAHLHFETDEDNTAKRLGTATAMGLAMALIEGGYERFGKCNSSTCDDVFVDTSRNRSQLRCSDTCTTRENVAAHRARQRKKS